MGVNYANLYINNIAGATLGAAITTTNVTGDLRVQSGTLNNGGFAITGNAGKAYEVANSATAEYSGASIAPSGFGTFTSGSTYSVASGGTLTLQGSSGNLLTLAPSSTTDWNLTVDNAASTNVSYISVSHSNAGGGKQIDASNGTNTDGGNNTNWLFGSGRGNNQQMNFNGVDINGRNIN